MMPTETKLAPLWKKSAKREGHEKKLPSTKGESVGRGRAHNERQKKGAAQRREKVIAQIRKNPGISAADLRTALGIKAHLLASDIVRLNQQGLIRFERSKHMHYFPRAAQ